jgi:hypothetical protein
MEFRILGHRISRFSKVETAFLKKKILGLTIDNLKKNLLFSQYSIFFKIKILKKNTVLGSNWGFLKKGQLLQLNIIIK